AGDCADIHTIYACLRSLLIRLDPPPMRILQRSRVHLEQVSKRANLIEADRDLVLEYKPANSLSAGRSGERTRVGPVATVGRQKAARIDHVRHGLLRAGCLG